MRTKSLLRAGSVACVLLAAAALLSACAHQSAKIARTSRGSGFVTSVSGVPVAYEVRGEGPIALVFVHGWSCDRSYWSAQLGPFSRQYKTVAIDLTGHGESGLGQPQNWTIGSFGADVAAVVEKLGLQRVVLIGHSMGGDVVTEAARRLPGRVEGLIWIDTYKQLGTYRTPEQVQATVAPFRESFTETTRTFVRGMFPPTANESLVERVAADMSSAPSAVSLASMESSFSYDRLTPATLQRLKLPVIAINPDNGPTDRASMERYGIEVIVMPGVGHFLMMEDPERFNPLLSSLIEKLSG